MHIKVWEAMLEIVSSGEADAVEAREGRGYQEHLAGWEIVLPVGNFQDKKEAIRSWITMKSPEMKCLIW